ncbi:DNA polymerase III subunit alpha [Arthrobacter sp. TMP15]|uniref:DNA polymerase III subunit alpha n=1 Tax=Arthrobacter sp. TMP15 TaxID=3140789 RepID=UPI0031BA562A
MRNFVHLHSYSAYSAHFGVSWPDDLAQTAAVDGDALAVTDRDGLYGSVKHVKACMAAGIDPIIGVDLAVLEEGSEGLEKVGRVVVLAHGNACMAPGAGYAALCSLISAAHNQPVVGITLEQLAAGVLDPETQKPALTVLLGPYSPVGRSLNGRKYLLPRTKFLAWRNAMPAGSMVVEILSHLSTPGAPMSTAHAVRMLKLAQEFGVPAVLSNAARYTREEDAPTADVLDAARNIAPLERLHDLQPTGQAWLKSAAQMAAVAKEIVYQSGYGSAELEQLWANTAQLADKCRLDPASDLGWKKPTTPELDVLGLSQPAGIELRQRSEAGLVQRFADLRGEKLHKVRNRLEMELATIGGLGFESYFLTVAEVSEMIREMGVRRAARGSGASSLVNYVLGVSAVDPIANDLLFERFLSSDRSTLPDIDLDVESAQRHNVYRRIFSRFGAKRVTLMSMQNSYRARGAVRDAGLALGIEKREIDQIAKQLWRFSAGSFREALEEKPELRDFAAQVRQSRYNQEGGDPEGEEREEFSQAGGARERGGQLDLLVDLTERLDRLPRHISMHPCGVILGDSSLLSRTPVQPSGMGLPMSQFDKHDMDAMGMLKLDVLGVRMQSAMAYAVREVIRLHPSKKAVAAEGGHTPDAPFIGEDGGIDLDAVPLDDEPTFELIRSTHTLGCFQIESPGQRELVGKMAPTEFSDLVIDISLFRPGPMKSNMVKPFLESRAGFAQAHYAHSDLIPVLQETHGVTVFHEQVLRTFSTMTKCTLSRADEFRRQLGNPMLEPVVEKYFRDNSAEHGYSQAVIEEVWETLRAFGSFGFCKAHGAAFAIPTYQSAWLKAHHPAEFLAGLWEHDPGMYPRRLLVSEARRLGIPILALDINASTGEYRAERVIKDVVGRYVSGKDAEGEAVTGIRLSLAGVYGLSGTELKRIVAGQPYESLADLRDRAKMSRPTLKRLAQLGALDSLHRQAQVGTGNTANRADLVAHVNSLPAHKSNKRTQAITGQLALPLEDIELGSLQAIHSPADLAQTVGTELDLLSLDVSGHLMDSYAPLLDRLGVIRAEHLLALRNNTEVLVAGVRVATQTPPMRGGKRVVFISIDDGTGCVDTTFFTEAQEKSGPLLFGTRILLIRGLTRRTGPRGITVQALEAWDLQNTHLLPEPPVLVGAPANRYHQRGSQQPPYVA